MDLLAFALSFRVPIIFILLLFYEMANSSWKKQLNVSLEFSIAGIDLILGRTRASASKAKHPVQNPHVIYAVEI